MNLDERKVNHLWLKRGHKTDDTDDIGGYRAQLYPGSDSTQTAGRFSSSSDHWEPKANIYITKLSKNKPADQWPLLT